MYLCITERKIKMKVRKNLEIQENNGICYDIYRGNRHEFGLLIDFTKFGQLVAWRNLCLEYDEAEQNKILGYLSIKKYIPSNKYDLFTDEEFDNANMYDAVRKNKYTKYYYTNKVIDDKVDKMYDALSPKEKLLADVMSTMKSPLLSGLEKEYVLNFEDGIAYEKQYEDANRFLNKANESDIKSCLDRLNKLKA